MSSKGVTTRHKTHENYESEERLKVSTLDTKHMSTLEMVLFCLCGSLLNLAFNLFVAQARLLWLKKAMAASYQKKALKLEADIMFPPVRCKRRSLGRVKYIGILATPPFTNTIQQIQP